LTTDFTKGQNPNREMVTKKGQRRWTEREGLARACNLFNGDPHERLALREPMYSSFHKDGHFFNAPIGKGLNDWEVKKKIRADIDSKDNLGACESGEGMHAGIHSHNASNHGLEIDVVHEQLPEKSQSMFHRVKSMQNTL